MLLAASDVTVKVSYSYLKSALGGDVGYLVNTLSIGATLYSRYLELCGAPPGTNLEINPDLVGTLG